MANREQEATRDCIIKLQKLKNSISNSCDYTSLQKCMTRLQKIRLQAMSLEKAKSRREINSLASACEVLIKEKIKYFKHKIKKIANSRNLSCSDTNETLKMCKSVQHLRHMSKNEQQIVPRAQQRLITHFQPSLAEQSKPKEVSRTQSNRDLKSLLKGKFKIVDNQMQNFKNKLKQIEGKVEKDDLKGVFEGRNNLVIEKYQLKLRDKLMENQELKAKNIRLEEHNTDLKNRVLNQQRRQNEYIESLKYQILVLNREVERLAKQNKTLDQYQCSLQKQNQLQNSEMHKLIRKYEQERLRRQKDMQQKNNESSAQFEQMRKQLEHLSRQEMYVKQIEKMVQNQSLQRAKSDEKYQIVLRQNDDLRCQIRSVIFDKEKQEQIIDKLNQEMLASKANKQKLQSLVTKLEQDLYETKKQLLILQRQKESQIMERESAMKDKATKLKQVRAMLQQLN